MQTNTFTIIPGLFASDNSSQPHYPVINSLHDEIRLLRLLPGSQNAKICCHLFVASLNDKPYYEALSYVWGNASDRRNISLGVHNFSVTANLEKALRHLRSCDKERVLWVDALCINQSDIEEKQLQIQKMRSIYHSAQQVLAWTGEADGESNEVLHLLNYLSQPVVFVYLYQLSSDPKALRIMSFDSKWRKLFRFLNRPYWNRVWILQELAIPGTSIYENFHSRKIQVGVGRTWLPVSSFNLALMSFGLIERSFLSSPAYLERPESSFLQNSCAAIMMFTVAQTCTKCPSKPKENIGTLLRMTHFLKATDPRDKIYALIALARDEDRALLPDYSISTVHMLRNLVRHLIYVDKSLAILSGNRRLPFECTGEWSSWVPDPERTIHTTRSDWDPETTPFKVCTSTAPVVTFSDDLSLLTVAGISIGKITTVIGPADWKTFPGLTSNDLPQSAVMQCLRQLEKFGSSLSKCRREIFWRTLVLDSEELEHGRRVYPAPGEIGSWFEVMAGDSSASGETEAVDCYRKFYQQVGIVQRCFYTTSTGEMGVGPFETLPGDLVTMLYGGQFCYILREIGEHYILVGSSYLHGVMYGELENQGNKWRECSEERTFVLR